MAVLRYATMLIAVVAYFVSGIGLTCFNKWLLGSRWYGFGFPVTLILCHMITNFAFAAVVISSCLSTQLQSSSFHPRRLSFSLFLHRFVPIGILFALDITLTNVSFKYIPVSLTEVIKGFVPAALMLHEMAARRLRGLQSRSLYPKSCVVFMLSLGIALTSYGEVDFNWTGCSAAVGALCAAVAKLILLERLLGEQELHYRPALSNGQEERQVEDAAPNGLPQQQLSSSPPDVLKQPSGVQMTKMPQLPSSAANGTEHEPPARDDETAANGDLRRRSPPVSPPDSGSELPALTLPSSSTGKAASSAAMPMVVKSSHRVLRSEVRRLHPMLSLFYFAPVAAFVLVPTFFALDYPTLMRPEPGALSFVSSSDVVMGTALLILFGAGMAFALNVSELFVMQSTSALTLCVVATVKFLLVVVLTSVAFQQRMSPINVFGCCVSVIGIAGYNVIKLREMHERDEDDAAAAAALQRVDGHTAKTEQTAQQQQQQSTAAAAPAALASVSHVNGHSGGGLIRGGFARAKARVKRWASDRRRSQQYQKVDDDSNSGPFDVDDLDVSTAAAAEPDDLPPPPLALPEV